MTTTSVSSSVSKRAEHVDERRADDRIAADADDRRVPEPALRELVADLVRERPRAADEADPALAEHLGGDDPDVRLARRERARAVRAEHRDPLRPDVVVDPQHLVRRRRPRRRRSRSRCPRRRPRRSRPPRSAPARRRASCSRRSRRPRRATVLKTGIPDTSWPPLPGRDARDDVRPVVAVAHRVERALRARDALDDEPRLVADDDRHQRFLALKMARSSRSLPSSTRSASSSRIRSRSSSGVPDRSSHASKSIRLSSSSNASTSSPRRVEHRAPLVLGVVPHVRRVAQPVGFLAGLAHEQVVRDEHQRRG